MKSLMTRSIMLLAFALFICQHGSQAASAGAYTNLDVPLVSSWMEYSQPGGPTFIGCYERDHFEEIYRTQTGYTFVVTGTEHNPTYEYAQLDGAGDIVGSGLLVGIDSPPDESYMLERSGQAEEDIAEKWHAFSNEMEQSVANSLDDYDPPSGITVRKVAVILVEFSDRPHVEGSAFINDDYQNFYWGQTTENIETFLNAHDTYHGEQLGAIPGDGLYNENLHPNQGEYVFRSVRDYWLEATYGYYQFDFNIVNDRDETGEAEWLMMDEVRELTNGTSVMESAGFWHNNWQLIPGHAPSENITFRNDVFERIDRDHPAWLLDADANTPGYQPYDHYLIFYPGGPDGQGRVYNFTTLPIYQQNNDVPPCIAWPLLWIPNPSQSANATPHFTHIGHLVHEFGHLALPLTDLRGGGFAAIMAQGNNCGVDRRDNNPCRLGAYSELRELHLYQRLSHDNLGQIIPLNETSEDIEVSLPTLNGHTIYALPNYIDWNDDCGPTYSYYLESRKVSLRTEAHLRTGIDDHILLEPYNGISVFDYNDYTSENQLVVWRDDGSDDGGWQRVVRNQPTMSSRRKPDSGGGSEFFFFWPGHLQTETQNSANLTPYSFPSIGSACGALLNITPNDNEDVVTFDYRSDYRNWEGRTHPIVVSQDEFVLGNHYYRDDIIVRNNATLWLHATYGCNGNDCTDDWSSLTGFRSKLVFRNGAGLIIDVDGRLRGIPKTTNNGLTYSASIIGDDSWSGVRVLSSYAKNNLCAFVQGTSRSRPGLVVSGWLQLDWSVISAHEFGIWALPYSTIKLNNCLVQLNKIGIIAAQGATILLDESTVQSNYDLGMHLVGGWGRLERSIVRNNGQQASDEYAIGGIYSDYGQSLGMECSEVQNNSGPGLFVANSSIFLTPSITDEWGGNSITGNNWGFGQVMLSDGYMHVESGHNQISDNGHIDRPLVYYDGQESQPVMNVDNNYWGYSEGHIEDIRARLQPEEAFEINTYDPSFALCGQNGGPTEVDCDQIWASAQVNMASLDYSLAATKFKDIVENYSTCNKAPWSANKLAIARIQSDSSAQSVREELLDLASTATQTELKNSLSICAAVLSGLGSDFETAIIELDSLEAIATDDDSLSVVASKAYVKFIRSIQDTSELENYQLNIDTLKSTLKELESFWCNSLIYKPSASHIPLSHIASSTSISELDVDAFCRDSIAIASCRVIYRLLPDSKWYDSSMTREANDTTWSFGVELDSLGGGMEYRFIVIDDSGRYETLPQSGGYPDSTVATTYFASIEPRLTSPLTDTAYVYAPGVITDDIVIGDGGVLYILPAPVELDSYVVAIDSGVGIAIANDVDGTGMLVLAGTDSTEVILECADQGDRWAGVTVTDGVLIADHVKMLEATLPIDAHKNTAKPSVYLDNVTISGFSLPLSFNDVSTVGTDTSYIRNCVIENGDSSGMIIGASDDRLIVENLTIRECGDDGLVLSESCVDLFSNLTVTSNGRFGIFTETATGNSARLSNCYIAFNGDTLPEIKVNSYSTIDVSDYAGNIVKDSTGVLFECEEVNDFDAELGSNSFVLADSTGKYFNVTSMSGPSYITGNTFFPETVNQTTFIDDYMKDDDLSNWVYSYLRAENQMDEVIEDPSGSIDFELKAYVQDYLGTVANDTITEVGFKFRVFPDSTNWTTYRQSTVESDSLYDWSVTVGDQGGLVSYIWWAKDAHGRYLTSPADADTTTPDSGATHYLSFEMSDSVITNDSLTIWAPTTLTHDIRVGHGGRLVIKPWPGATDHTVTLAEGVSINISPTTFGNSPKMWILGTESMPIVLDAESDTSQWEQLYIFSGTLEATYTTFRSNVVALEQGAYLTPVVKLDHCTFEQSDGYFYLQGPDNSESYIRDCVFRDLGTTWDVGSFLVLDGDIEITDSWFYNNNGSGIILYNAGTTEISGCNSIANDMNGLLSWGLVSSVTVGCSEFSYNGGDSTAEVYMDDGTFDFSSDAGNVFADKAGALLEAPSMSCFELVDGGNGFYLFDSTGYYIYTDDETDTMDVSGNLWYPWTPDTSIFQDYFDPDTSRFWDWSDPAEALAACGVGGISSVPGGVATLVRPSQTTYSTSSHNGYASKTATATKHTSKLSAKSTAFSKSVDMTSYTDAVQAQKHRQYDQAKDLYASFITANPDHPQTEAALSRLMVSAKKSGKMSGLSEYFERLESRSLNPRVQKAAKFLKLEAMIDEGRNQEALSTYDDIIRHPESLHDSITAVIGATRVLFKNQTTKLSTSYPENQPESFTDMCRRIIHLMSSERRQNRVLDEQPQEAVLPTSYELYQNYPNPFNPTTEIRFDLPEAVRAELKVFNILGQEVVTLVDDVRNAGAYRILWDGKNAAGMTVASGVYIYQLKTPNFTNAKKMMLLR